MKLVLYLCFVLPGVQREGCVDYLPSQGHHVDWSVYNIVP